MIGAIMVKALLQKQFLAFTAFFTQGKDGKQRSKGAIIGYAALLLYAFLAIGGMFFMLAFAVCQPLVEAGQGWVYFAFMSVIATALGIIGGVFMAKSALYEAKDNDLLFSMPIPSWAILFTRMLGLYLFTFAFEFCVLFPAIVTYFAIAGFSFAAFVCGLIALVVLPLFAVGTCCLLGFVISWLIAKLPFKNLFTVLLFLVFMVGYSVIYSKVNEYMGALLQNIGVVSGVMETWLYPFGVAGRAMAGELLSLLLFLIMFGGFFALVYAILSLTYIRIVTCKGGEYRAKYKEKETRSLSPQLALIKKEFWRLVKSPAYLLNASMGTMIMIIVAVMMAIFGDFFGVNADMVASIPGLAPAMGLIVAVVVCFMASSNTISASAVSLEGQSISIIQSMPVSEWKILLAKFYLHFLFTAFPDVVLGIAMSLILELEWFMVLGVVLSAVIASALFAAFGLMHNLKLPNLHWTNETVAVKQGFSVAIAMFGGWGITLLPLGVYFLFGAYLPPVLYLFIWLILFALATVLLLLWIKKRGTMIFKKLTV